MKKTLILCLLSLSYASQAQTDPFLTELKTRLAHAKASTLQMARDMPEAKYAYKPTPEEMTFRAQLLHMAQNITWLTATHLTTKPNPLTAAMTQDAGQSKAEVEATVGAAFDYAIEAIGAFDPANLEQSVKFFAGPLSKRQIMMLLNDHQTHHRGQLVVYQRLNGIKPPEYVGW